MLTPWIYMKLKVEILSVYTGDFEMIWSMLFAELEQKKTIFRFRNVDDFETYNIAIDVDYDIEDVIFTGCSYKINTREFSKEKRSQYGKGTKFKQDIVKYIGNNCYISTSGNCFVNGTKYLTGRE